MSPIPSPPVTSPRLPPARPRPHRDDRRSRQRRHLAEKGVDATATILAARETGSRINHQPVVDLTLRIDAAGQSPYTVLHKMTVGVLDAARIQPGAVLPVRIDPSDRTFLQL